MKYLYRFSTPKSTNIIAGSCIGEMPFVLYTYRQKAGRGMGTNSWFSGGGKNIAMSLCFEPKFLSPDRQFLLNIALSMALRNALQSLLPLQKVLLKWPNDIYVCSPSGLEGKKLAGILFENKISWSGSGNSSNESNGGNSNNGSDAEFSKSIMGIGININQKKFPSDLPNPTSMLLASSERFCKKKIVRQICSALENAFYALADSLSEKGYDAVWTEMKAAYLSCLFYYGLARNYIYKGTPIIGSIVDIDNFGRILLKTDVGDSLFCDIKELKMP